MDISNDVQLKSLPSSFTFWFWVIKQEDLIQIQQSFNLLNAFDRLFFTATLDPSTQKMHCLQFSFDVNTFGTHLTIPSSPCSIQSLPLNTWTKVAVSVKATLSSQFDMNLYLYTPNTAPFH
jgi:hypothetical protein